MSERDEIRRIVAEILELPLTELDDGASFTEVYFADSLERYRIVLALETFFDLHFPPEALDKIQSVESAERAIRALPAGDERRRI